MVVKPEEPIYIAEPVPIDDFSKQQTIGKIISSLYVHNTLRTAKSY